MKDDLLQREYSIPYALFAKAFTVFQHKFVYPRCWITTGLLAVVIAIYTRAALQDPTNTLTYLLIFACLAVICIQWYNPKKIRRQLLNAIRELGDESYRLTVRQDGLTIGTLLPEPVQEDTPEEEATEESGDGFHAILPEEPPVLEDTVITFGKHVKIVETVKSKEFVHKVEILVDRLHLVDKNNVLSINLILLFSEKHSNYDY